MELSREEWLEKRKGYLCATDIAPILGLSKWKTPYQVWLDKLGFAEPSEIGEPAKWGLLLEPVVAQEFGLRHPEIFLQKGEFCTKDWRGATPDYVAGHDFGLEIKTAGSRMAAHWGAEDDQIPSEYLCQIHWQAIVTGRSDWYCAALIGGQDYREYRITIDLNLCTVIEREAQKWWHDYVVARVQPPVEAGDNAILSKYLQTGIDAYISPSDEIDLLAKELLVLKAKLAELETEKDEKEAKIKQFIGEHKGILSKNYRVNWSTVTKKPSFDWESACKEAGVGVELLARHTKPSSTYRRFSITEL